MTLDQRRQAYNLLADILEYPGPDYAEKVRDCLELLEGLEPDAAEHLKEFLAYVESVPLGRLQEVYIATFEIGGICAPNIAYHLLGEGTKQTAFMVKVKEALREHGIDSGTEMPDHLPLALKLVAVMRDDGDAASFIEECLVPALQRMTIPFRNERSPYSRVIRATLAVVKNDERKLMEYSGGVNGD